MLALGGAATWFVIGRRAPPAPAMLTVTPPLVPSAVATAVPADLPAGTTAAPTVVPSSTVEVDPGPAAHAQIPSAKPYAPPGHHGGAPPPHPPPPPPSPPSPPGGGDKRLGF
jgi:hypothetical protein